MPTTTGWHWDPTHVPPWQGCPHDPQFSLSLVVSTQTPLHVVGKAAEHPHAPLLQVSFVPHVVPSVATWLLHECDVAPVDVQVPGVWHESLAAHATGLAPVQVPPWQVSTCVQPLPSLHTVPF